MVIDSPYEINLFFNNIYEINLDLISIDLTSNMLNCSLLGHAKVIMYIVKRNCNNAFDKLDSIILHLKFYFIHAIL